MIRYDSVYLTVCIDCLLIYCVVIIVFYCVAYSLFFFFYNFLMAFVRLLLNSSLSLSLA